MLAAGISCTLLTVLFFFLPGMRDTELEGSPDQVVLSEPVQEGVTTLPSSAESLAASSTSSPETAS
jgi:hypothetical protein